MPHDPASAEVWALVHPDGTVAVQNLPAGEGRAREVCSVHDAAGELSVSVDGAPVPVAYARTLDNDAVTFAGADGVTWTAFHADGASVGAVGRDGSPPTRRAGLYFVTDERVGLFQACDRPGGTRRPGTRLRDQITDDELRAALASARSRRHDDA